MIIDIHTHVFPDNLAKGAIENLSNKSNISALTDGTINNTVEFMKKCGIDYFVVQNIAVTERSQKKVNDFTISLDSENIIAFGSVNPFSNEAISELIRLKNNGIKGIKFHNEYQNFNPDDENALKIYEKCIELGLVIMFHGGKDLGFVPPYHSMPEKFLNVYKNLPYNKYIIAHMGGYAMYKDAVKYLADTLINIDTSYALPIMDKKLSEYVIDAFTTKRVLFGSDCPWSSPAQNLQALKKLKYQNEDYERITYLNAIELLNIKQPQII
jgi:hypothetical protein